MENNYNRILFICPDINKPSGGIKQIYRQVDALSKNGFNAFTLHGTTGFRCNWFDNDTPVVYNSSLFKELASLKPKQKLSLKQKIKSYIKNSAKFFRKISLKSDDIEIKSDDILVFPEIYGPRLAEVIPGIRKVVYNQGAYQTFFGYNLDLSDKNTPYLHKDLISVIVNSQDAKDYMNLAFPNLNVYRVKYGFDHKKFLNDTPKKKQISFMPRRLKPDIGQVINILKFKGFLDDWEIKPIENMSETQVAECMKESAIFLSFNINEGFGMPPAEAMACGCIVAGYPGHGGNEIFKPEFAFPVVNRDIQGYVKVLENVIREYDDDKTALVEKSKMASNFILNTYSLKEEENSILNAWNTILQINT